MTAWHEIEIGKKAAMEPQLAKLVALTAFRSAAEINNLLPLLKERCSDTEYKSYARAIATASAEIGQQILNKVFIEHPELRQELETKIQIYGRVF